MKYTSKLYLAFLATAVVSTAIGIRMTNLQVKKILLEKLHSNTTSISASAAASIDPTLVQQLLINPNNKSAAHRALETQLQKIRDRNRRADVYVKYIYILSPVGPGSRHFNYLVDAEKQDVKDYSPFIKLATDEANSSNLIEHLSQSFSPTDLIRDPLGLWMVGYSPIYDQNGKYLASLGVNMYASSKSFEFGKVVMAGLSSFGVTLLLALFAAWYLSIRQTKSLKKLHKGVTAIKDGDLSQVIEIESNDEFAELSAEVNRMAQGLRERERLLMSFTRYVSQHIMESILNSEEQIKLSGEKRKVTVLFSDIRNFTTISEKHDPEMVVALLNEYFAIMIEIIFRNKGTLDKFIGDGIMVEFGVPLDDTRQEYNAVKTALEMRAEMTVLRRKWANEGKPDVEIGIGIHTGCAVVGNIGSEKHIQYTAIGDAVNVASRIEQLTKELKIPILISEATVRSIYADFNFKQIGPQIIRGRTEAITVYTVDKLLTPLGK